MQWKVEALQHELKHFYGGRSWKNIVSIGNSFDELEALEEITFLHDNPHSLSSGCQKPLHVKTVKLLNCRTIHELTVQAAALRWYMDSLVCFDGDYEIHVQLDDRAAAVLHLTEMCVEKWHLGGAEWADSLREALRDPKLLLHTESAQDFSTVVKEAEALIARGAPSMTQFDERGFGNLSMASVAPQPSVQTVESLSCSSSSTVPG